MLDELAEPDQKSVASASSTGLKTRVPKPKRRVKGKRCDFCAEIIRADAKKCKHCGETLDATLRVAEEARRISRTSAGSIVQITNQPQSAPFQRLERYPHVWQLLISVLFPPWLIVYALHYIYRDRSYYR